MDEIKKRGLVVATEDDFRPFEFVKDGTPTGFDNELIEDLRKYAPFEIKQQILPWTGILAGVSTGKYDAAITAAIITKERKQSLDFTSPIADATHYYVKRKDDKSRSPPSRTSAARRSACRPAAHCWRACPNLARRSRRTGGKLGKVVEYTSYPEAYQDLALGRVDYVVNTVINLQTLVKEKPIFEVGQAVFRKILPGLGRRQGNTELLAFPERLYRQGEGERPVRRAAEEMVRRIVPDLPVTFEPEF